MSRSSCLLKSRGLGHISLMTADQCDVGVFKAGTSDHEVRHVSAVGPGEQAAHKVRGIGCRVHMRPAVQLPAHLCLTCNRGRQLVLRSVGDNLASSQNENAV